MNGEAIYHMQMKLAAARAFSRLAGVEPTDEDLQEIEKQGQDSWLQQIEDEWTDETD